MNINTVDLNLFLIFQAVYVTRSVTLAGDRIGMTQSATSNALKRLRERFGDPLFVRTNEGMTPTPLAERLVAPIEAGLSQFSKAFDQGCQFDPATSDRVFTIAINDIGQMVMMPRLLAAAQQLAPHVRFETVDCSMTDARSSMVHGQLDLAVGSWKDMGQTFYQQRLFDETFVVLMSSSNPLARRDMSFDDYMAAAHVAYRPNGETETALQQTLSRASATGKRNIVLTAAHSLGLSAIVASSNLLLTSPSRLVKSLVDTRLGLELRPLPFSMAPLVVRQQWHERIHLDNGNRWLRELFFSLFHSPPSQLKTPAAQESRSLETALDEL
ncbi:MAG: transcriptional regulator, LysR family [Polaromonas sp.]|nr:transcriptional regulator, LysR family [Polaromonas sp.]